MNEREDELKKVLSAIEQYNADRAEAARQEQLKTFDARLTKTKASSGLGLICSALLLR